MWKITIQCVPWYELYDIMWYDGGYSREEKLIHSERLGSEIHRKEMIGYCKGKHLMKGSERGCWPKEKCSCFTAVLCSLSFLLVIPMTCISLFGLNIVIQPPPLPPWRYVAKFSVKETWHIFLITKCEY